MTEKEAIKEIKRWTGILMNAGSQCVNETAEAQEMAISVLEEIQQYRIIGTVEECREAIEKQKAKKPEYYGDSEDGKILCPNCQEDLWDLKECGFNTCPYCGQRLE